MGDDCVLRRRGYGAPLQKAVPCWHSLSPAHITALETQTNTTPLNYIKPKPTPKIRKKKPKKQIDDGVLQLERAERHQRGSRAMTCIFVLCALIFVFLILSIARHL
jgi:hypothetical protein